MSTLYLSEQGATVRYRKGRLEITRDDTTVATVPPAEVDHVACFGRVAFTPAAMTECLKRGVPISIHTLRGHCRGIVQPDEPCAGILREALWRAALSPDQRLEYARAAVQAKCRAARALLRAKRKDTPIPDDALPRIDSAHQEAATATTMEMLLGCEGNASRAYYSALRALLPPKWPFPKRQYHPAPDATNALLSFAYGLANNYLASELTAVGLDLAAGFLHRPQRNRPSLSLDLLEPFRPLVCDRLVLRLTRMRILLPTDFTTQTDGACRMNPTTERRVLQAWDELLHSPHELLHHTTPAHTFRHEAQRLARALRLEEAPWHPLPHLP